MAAQRGGRRRASQQDAVRSALIAALADALDVAPDRVAVTVTLDDGPVPADRLPLALTLAAEAAEAPEPAAGAAAEEREAEDVDGEGDADDAGPDTDRRSSGPGDGRDAARAPIDSADLDAEAEAAADLLEGLLDAMDLPGDLRISVQDSHAEVEVVGLEEGVLIGRRGQTLDAVQELVRTAMQRRFERRSRVLVDVDGYRARRMEKLLERADEAVEEVLASGEPQRLEPMDSIERRIVHQRVAETEGVVSTSHGREPSRRIVIELAED